MSDVSMPAAPFLPITVSASAMRSVTSVESGATTLAGRAVDAKEVSPPSKEEADSLGKRPCRLTCATHGACTQLCTEGKVHGVGVHHVWYSG